MSAARLHFRMCLSVGLMLANLPPSGAIGQVPLALDSNLPADSTGGSSVRCENYRCCKPVQQPSFLGCIFQTQRAKAEVLQQKRFMLPPHQAYDSPLEMNYFFRPNSPSQIESQRRFMSDRANPYDNREFQTLYDHPAHK